MRKALTIKVKSKTTTLKYVINSLVATTADFLTFFLGVNGLHLETVFATLLGNTAGAGVSYSVQHHWVFKHKSEQKMRVRIAKFAVGVAISMLSNMVLVSLLHYLFGWAPWPARVGAAIGAWSLGYWFNKKIVFK
jgi:putative flippase GtrA